MYTFTVTKDRHQGRYGFKTSNFPSEYSPYESEMNYIKDPDFVTKVQISRVPVKLLLFTGCLFVYMMYSRVKRVEEFDKLKRVEQRAMQNSEIEDLFNKKVQFILFDANGKEFTE